MAIAKSEIATITVGENLRRLRQGRGLTQIDLSRRSGISQGAISLYERGGSDMVASTIIRLAKALGVSPREFFDGID